MAIGLPPRHTEHFSIGPHDPDDLRGAVKEALDALSWSVREETPDRLVAATRMTLRSWGEKVPIDFLADGSITFTSECSDPMQWHDWGKNKVNLKKFLAKHSERA